MKQFSSDIRYVEATPRKQRKKSGAYSVISAGVSSSADNSALKSYVDSNFISLATGQDVSALHNFLNGFNLAGIPFRKMANGSLFIDANVVFGGGATMYGTDTTPAPSLFDGLPIDNETIYWDGGVLKAMGGGGGGGVADSVAWANVYGKPTWITNTKPTYNYSEIQGTPDLSMYALASAIPTNNNQLTNGAGYITSSALNGYATETFVNTAVNGAKEWVEEQQYLTEITSGMIESVLGYQPYDGDTNRLGFLTSSALNGYATQSWVNTALSGYFLTSNFTKANIKSTLGISDWALSSSLEWGAINSKPTDINGYGMVEYLTNLNNATLDKFFRSSFQASNRPAYNYAVGFTLGNGSASANYAAQLAIDYYGGVHTRYKASTEWSEWVELAPLSSIPTKLSQLTDDVVVGKYLPLSGGMIYGNGADLLGINRIDGNPAIVFYHNNTTMGRLGFDTSGDAVAQVGGEYKKILHSGNYSEYTFGWESAYSKDLNSVYNAILSGGSFLNAPNGLQYGALLTLPYREVTGNQKQDFATQIYVPNGDYNGCAIYWRGALSNQWQAWRVLLDSSNYSNYALPITGGTIKGNLLTEGGITMYSQRSLKNILSYDGLSLEQLSVIKPIKFTWKDGRDNRYHVGGVADDVATVVPEVVYSTNDFLTMDYGNAGFYVAASLIKPVIYCYNKVEKHEKDIDYLKRENVAVKNENKALREEIRQLKQAA